jgi:hypothetical protein
VLVRNAIAEVNTFDVTLLPCHRFRILEGELEHRNNP